MRNVPVAICLLAALAEASPVYYTFEGNVTQILDYGAGLAGDISSGDAVTFRFLVDFDRQGYWVQWNGTAREAEGLFFFGAG